MAKLRWEERSDPDESDDDDVMEFDKMRKVNHAHLQRIDLSDLFPQDLRTFLDSALAIDQDIVTNAVQTLAFEIISAYRQGVPLKWNDVELAVYLVFIFGEINKSQCVCGPHVDYGTHLRGHRRRQGPHCLLPGPPWR